MDKVSAHQARIASLLGHDLRRHSEIQLESAGVFLSGHFRLRDRFHSTRYVRFTEEFFQTEFGKKTLETFLEELSGSSKIKLREAQIFFGPTRGGWIMAQAYGKMLGIPAVRVQKNENSETGYEISPADRKALAGKRAVGFDDVISTGITLGLYVLPLVRRAKANVLGVAVLANRGNLTMSLLCPLQEYWKISDMSCFPVEDCPLCQSKVPITEF